MLKGQKKHIDKEKGKTKHEESRRVNYRATQNKNNIGTTSLERSVVYTAGGLKAFHCTNLTLGPDIILNTKNTSQFLTKMRRKLLKTSSHTHNYRKCTHCILPHTPYTRGTIRIKTFLSSPVISIRRQFQKLQTFSYCIFCI